MPDELDVDEVPAEGADAVHVAHARLLDDEAREPVLDHGVAELPARERPGDELGAVRDLVRRREPDAGVVGHGVVEGVAVEAESGRALERAAEVTACRADRARGQLGRRGRSGREALAVEHPDQRLGRAPHVLAIALVSASVLLAILPFASAREGGGDRRLQRCGRRDRRAALACERALRRALHLLPEGVVQLARRSSPSRVGIRARPCRCSRA